MATELISRWVYIFGMENGGLINELFGESWFSAGLYKIGTTANPSRRWQQVQIHSPWDLRVFALLPGSFSEESEMHYRLEEYRIRGEWFEIYPNVMCELLQSLEGRLNIGKLMYPSLPWATFISAEEVK